MQGRDWAYGFQDGPHAVVPLFCLMSRWLPWKLLLCLPPFSATFPLTAGTLRAGPPWIRARPHQGSQGLGSMSRTADEDARRVG